MADEMNETPEAAVVEAPVEAPVVPAPAPAGEQPEQQVAPRGEGRRFTPGAKRFARRKVCIFCVDKLDYVDYKDVKRLRKFVTERGKLLPRRISGNCASHQRMLTRAVKRARVIALLPFRGE